tara:strand:+ start:2466 stop:2717 length:252 start_codon:yes stop_codon:yes gene_type:complete
MQKLFENWQKFVKEEHEDQERNPKVVCNCLCTDCFFNKNKRCVAKAIDLQFAQKEDGSTICECVTYERQGTGMESRRDTLEEQ